MVISEKYKYIFIEVAKTGSTSIKKFLLENDISATVNQVIDKNGRIVKVPVHVSAKELKSIMGQRFDDYSIIGFVRNPFSTIVSNYHFYKNGRAFKNVDRKRFSIKLKVKLANIVPFWVWALFYPYKLNWHFVSDGDKVIVDYLGRYSYLDEDFFTIFREIGLTFRENRLPVLNLSTHRNEDSYYGTVLKKLVSMRVRKDIQLLQSVQDKR